MMESLQGHLRRRGHLQGHLLNLTRTLRTHFGGSSLVRVRVENPKNSPHCPHCPSGKEGSMTVRKPNNSPYTIRGSFSNYRVEKEMI